MCRIDEYEVLCQAVVCKVMNIGGGGGCFNNVWAFSLVPEQPSVAAMKDSVACIWLIWNTFIHCCNYEIS